MEDCLVCTLKGVIENDTLLAFDEFEIVRKKRESTFDSDAASLLLRNAEDFTVRVTGNGYFATTFAGLDDPGSRLTTIDLQADTDVRLYFSNDDYSIIVNNKYDIVKITAAQNSGFNIDISELSYSTSLTTLSLPVTTGRDGISGDISDLKNTSIDTFRTATDNPYGYVKANRLVSGNLSELPNSIKTLAINKCAKVKGALTDLPTNMTYLCISNTDVSGTSTELGRFTTVNRFAIGGTKITGSIEDFVSSLISNGRNSANNMFIYGMFANFTFGGTFLSSNVNMPLRMAYENLISTENRIKIVVHGSTTSYKIWCSGCTSEEITEWINDGYTVVAVDNIDPE